MKIVITGGNGMLGRTLRRVLNTHEIVSADLPDWDITNFDNFYFRLNNEKPDVVIHCAAMTKVDDCESNEQLAYRINEEGSRNVAKACKNVGAKLIAISTDYVFSGNVEDGKKEWTEEDVPRPQTVYGMSKFAGEEVMLSFCPDAIIVRIAWLYGFGGPSFLHTIAKLGTVEGDAIKVVNDQVGNPTSAIAVANVIDFLISHKDVSGIVHATCEGICSWYEYAMEIKRIFGNKFLRDIIPCTTEEFPRPASRPKNSALKNGVLKMLAYNMPNWQDALRDFVKAEFKL